jgi:hypothetical protein
MTFYRKYLPLINFCISSSALGFQIFVLYPWHKQLSDEFDDLKGKLQREPYIPVGKPTVSPTTPSL